MEIDSHQKLKAALITGKIVACPVPFCKHCNIRPEGRIALFLMAPTSPQNHAVRKAED